MTLRLDAGGCAAARQDRRRLADADQCKFKEGEEVEGGVRVARIERSGMRGMS